MGGVCTEGVCVEGVCKDRGCVGGICTEGACVLSCVSSRSGGGSSVGGAIGNWKWEEKDPDGFRPAVVGKAGVLGAVATPGRRLDGRAGKANSFAGSWMVGGKDAPPASGEGWVAERKPGEETVLMSANEARSPCCSYLDTRRACST